MGASLSKAGIEEDISVVVLTSKSSAVQSPTIAIYTLTGSSSCTSDITDVENGIYMAVSSWASGASYFLSDSKGNQLGTGTITAFGTASGTILGAWCVVLVPIVLRFLQFLGLFHKQCYCNIQLLSHIVECIYR